jgi:hypothetical protein
MRGETRQAATPKTLRIETYSQGDKISLKCTVWPAALPGDVPAHLMQALASDWKRGLVELNQRLIQITPPRDRVLLPVIPDNPDTFLGHCMSCLSYYSPAAVITAWNQVHLFLVDEHI